MESQPVINMLKERCLKNFVPVQNLAYDESMVKYYGRHGCKQFIRGMPIRFGYKMSLNTKDGYLVNFDLYQGKSPKANTDHSLCLIETLFEKAASPLLVMLDEIPLEKRQLRYHFYMDNLFSNPALFALFKFRGYSDVGTIRDNRLPSQCPLTNKTLFAKKDWGYFETATEKTDGHLYVRWMDNAVLTMIPSSCGTQPVGQVKPRVIGKYNSFMGGTDKMDQNLACYRVGTRGKKWYWPLHTWMLDVAMQNSWLLYNKSRKQKVSQLECRREVANVYLQRYQVLPKGPGIFQNNGKICNDNECSTLNMYNFPVTTGAVVCFKDFNDNKLSVKIVSTRYRNRYQALYHTFELNLTHDSISECKNPNSLCWNGKCFPDELHPNFDKTHKNGLKVVGQDIHARQTLSGVIHGAGIKYNAHGISEL